MKRILSLLIALSCAAQAQTTGLIQVQSPPPKYKVTVLTTGYGRGINSHGDVVGFVTNGQGFLYKNGRMTAILATVFHDAYPHETEAEAVNDFDEVVGEADDFNGSVPSLDSFVWQNWRMTLTALGTGDPPTGRAVANGISNLGWAIGSYDASDTAETLERGYIFRDGHMFTMPGLGGRNTFASGINNENQIVGISQNPQGVYDGFLYANGRMQSIGGKQSSNFTPIKINDHGEIAGTLGDQDGNSHACRLFQTGTNAGLILSIDNFPGSVFSSSVATGINNGGEISGYCWAFAIGESVMGIPFPGEVPATTKINVRSTPAGAVIGTQPNGVVGVIKAGPASAPANPAILNDVTTPWWNVTFPSGVSGWVGQIVLGLTAPTQTGFIFKDEKMYDLSQIVPGWQINSADGVNDNKQIVCTAYRPGQTTPYVLLLTFMGPGASQIMP